MKTGENMVRYLSNKNIHEYKIINSADIPFSQSVVDACKENRCGKYGTCWTCPPGVGDFRILEEKIKSYNKAVVFTRKFDLEDSFDFETMVTGAKSTAETLLKIKEELDIDGINYIALGCEVCVLCEKCTYPDSPCRFPDKATPSIEACGINVVELSRNIGIKYNNGANTVTYFCIILF